MKNMIKVTFENREYEMVEGFAYSERLDLAKQVFAECYDVDEQLGLVMAWLEKDAILTKALLPVYIPELALEISEMSAEAVMDKYEKLFYHLRFGEHDGQLGYADLDEVIDMVHEIAYKVEQRVKAQTSLSYRISALMDGLLNISDMMDTVVNADDITNKMLTAAQMFKDSENVNPTKKAGNSILNFAKK